TPFRTFSRVAHEYRAMKFFGCRAQITPESGRKLRSRNICGGLKTKRATISVVKNFYGACWNGRINTAASLSNSSSDWVVHAIGRANATRLMTLMLRLFQKFLSIFIARA